MTDNKQKQVNLLTPDTHSLEVARKIANTGYTIAMIGDYGDWPISCFRYLSENYMRWPDEYKYDVVNIVVLNKDFGSLSDIDYLDDFENYMRWSNLLYQCNHCFVKCEGDLSDPLFTFLLSRCYELSSQGKIELHLQVGKFNRSFLSELYKSVVRVHDRKLTFDKGNSGKIDSIFLNQMNATLKKDKC